MFSVSLKLKNTVNNAIDPYKAFTHERWWKYLNWWESWQHDNSLNIGNSFYSLDQQGNGQDTISFQNQGFYKSF